MHLPIRENSHQEDKHAAKVVRFANMIKLYNRTVEFAEILAQHPSFFCGALQAYIY
jgi:hypothetical protein